MKNFKERLKRWTIILCLFLIGTLTLYAQEIVRGEVKNTETQKPLANVTVVVEGTGLGTTTNKDGNFLLDVKSKEQIMLHCSCVGFKAVNIPASPGDSLAIKMEKETKTIGEVQITAYRNISPLENATVEPMALKTAIQTISAGEIETIGATNLLEAMKYTVAGSLTQMGRKRRLFYSSRGSSSEFAIDGISIYYSTDLTGAVSTSMIENIENIRSSNALLSGYSGLSGVINMKTKTFDNFSTEAQACYGTFNKIHANITHGGKTGNLGYALSVTKDKTDGPSDRNGAEDMWNLYGKLSYELNGKFLISVQHFYMNGMREFAQMQEGDNYILAAPKRAMIWKFDPLKFNVTLAKAKIFVNKSANTEFQFYNIDAKRHWNQRSYYVKTVTDPDNPNKKTMVLTDSIPSDYDVVNEPYDVIGGGIIQTIQPFKNNYLRISLNGSKYTYPSNTNYYGETSDTDIRSFTGVVVDEHNFNRISINAGVKLLRDYYKKYAPGSSSIYIEDEWQPVTVNVNAGASYAVSDRLLLNAQLSAGGINANKQAMKPVITDGDTIAEPIADENRKNIDLGMVYDFGKIGKVTVTGFYTKRKNASEYTGILYTNSLGVETEYQENIETKTYGLEFIWNSPLYGEWLSANANVTLMRTLETTGGVEERYERQPEIMLNGGIKAEKFGFTFTGNAKYIGEYIGDRFVTKKSTDQKIYVGDYLNIDLALSYLFPGFPVSVTGKVINLTDKRYATMTPVYPDYGRQFNIGVKCNF
jgi:hypothetical protein